MTRTAVRESFVTVASVGRKLIDLLGLCELSNARALHEAEKSEEIDEIINGGNSDKYGDHIHLTMCERTRNQPPKQRSSLAELIAQSEIKQAVNLDEYMRASNGKALDFGVNAFRDMESSSVQQSPVISRLHDVVLPNYFAELDGLVKATHNQKESEREARERTLEDPDFMMSAGPEETQNITGNAVSRSDMCKRTEEEWEYMSSREERYVMLVPLLDACEACRKEKRESKVKRGRARNTTALQSSEATNGFRSEGGADEIVQKTPENAPFVELTEALQAPEVDDAIFLEFTQETRENTPCMLISEVSNAPESDTQILGDTGEDTLGVPDTRDTQILQHDAAVFEQMSEDNLQFGTQDPESLQHDEVFFEQMEKTTTGIEVAERSDAPDIQVLDQMREDNLREPETLGTHTLQHNIGFERIGESTPWLQAIEGTNAMEPDKHAPERSTDDSPFPPATQGKDAMQQYSEFLDRISENPKRFQGPEAPDGLEPYVDILRRCPFSEKLDLRPMNTIFATPEPMAQADWQAKPSLASFKDRIHLLKLPLGIYPPQPSTKTKVAKQAPLRRTAGRPKKVRPQDPSSPEVMYLSSEKPRRLIIPSDIEDGGDVRLAHSPTRAHRKEASSELGVEDDLAFEGPPTQDFGSLSPTGAHLSQRSSELAMEGNPALGDSQIQDFRPSVLARAREHLHPSNIARADDARSNEGRSNTLGREGITGAPQPQLSSTWQVNPDWPDPDGFSPNITSSHPAETRQQQRLAEAGRESNSQWERQPQDFRPESITGAPQPQPSSIWQVYPNLRPGGDQRNLPSKPRAYDRYPPSGHPVQAFPQPQSRPKALPLGPPVQAFPPPRPWKDPRQKGNIVDVGARVQPQSQGQQIQTPLSGRPIGSMPAPMRQQDQRQAIWRPDTGGRLVSPSSEPLPPPRHQREAGVRGVLKVTGKQGKAPPPMSRPGSRHEPGSMSGKNKRSHEG